MPINLAAVPPDPELFNEDAEAWARKFNEVRNDRMNKPTQIRRFYDELVGWQERIDGDDDKFHQYEAFIRMMNAKVAYAKGRALVDDQFVAWFRECLKATTSAKALDHFRLHFEAVLGFLKALRA
ncbi:MAG: type III-A CRISPR-associated protein Csm2 [Candidatus Accumulibacter sp. UW20]|jgi:CRISPR-associated protein Csm2